MDVILGLFGGSLLKGRAVLAHIVVEFSHCHGFLSALRLLTSLVLSLASVG